MDVNLAVKNAADQNPSPVIRVVGLLVVNKLVNHLAHVVGLEFIPQRRIVRFDPLPYVAVALPGMSKSHALVPRGRGEEQRHVRCFRRRYLVRVAQKRR